MHINSIYYGHGAYGIESAAETYFHVHANQLGLPEASFLAGLPQSPSYYNALTEEGYARARARQAQVLHAMVAAGYISQAVAGSATQKDLLAEIKSGQQPVQTTHPDIAPHFADYILQEELPRLLGQDRVDRGGLKVITTLDPHAQQLAVQATATEVDAIARHTSLTSLTYADDDGVVRSHAAAGPNTGAMIVLSPTTGAILAMVGSR